METFEEATAGNSSGFGAVDETEDEVDSTRLNGNHVNGDESNYSTGTEEMYADESREEVREGEEVFEHEQAPLEERESMENSASGEIESNPDQFATSVSESPPAVLTQTVNEDLSSPEKQGEQADVRPSLDQLLIPSITNPLQPESDLQKFSSTGRRLKTVQRLDDEVIKGSKKMRAEYSKKDWIAKKKAKQTVVR